MSRLLINPRAISVLITPSTFTPRTADIRPREIGWV